MKLHFKHDAIVRFVVTCEANINACGRVVEVNENEVVFVPQEYVAAEEYCYGTSTLDRTISVDEYPERHLDRSIIGMWYYEPVPCNRNSTYSDVYQPSVVNELQGVNLYDEDLLCKGHGDYFE